MQITGEKVKIKETDNNDLKDLQRLWNNGEVMKSVGFPDGLNQTFAEMMLWFKSIQETDKANHYIILNKDNDFCGELFYRKDLEHKRAALDIKLLPEAQDKGLAAEALELFIDYIFKNKENIETVWTEPAEENKAARRLYSRVGLKEKKKPDDIGAEVPYWELTRTDWQALNN